MLKKLYYKKKTNYFEIFRLKKSSVKKKNLN